MMRFGLAAFFAVSVISAPLMAAELNCSGVQTGHLGQASICAEAKHTFTSYQGPLTLEILRDEGNALSARLVAAGQAGPRIDVTSAERVMTLRDVRRLAEGLLRSSDLP